MGPDKCAAARLKCALAMQTPRFSCADTFVNLEGGELCGSEHRRGWEDGSFGAVLHAELLLKGAGPTIALQHASSPDHYVRKGSAFVDGCLQPRAGLHTRWQTRT
jgi:hypothetical protein